MKRMKQHLWSVCLWTALIAFTAYISLDTFVLSRSYDTNAVGMNTAMFADVSAEEKAETAEVKTETAKDAVEITAEEPTVAAAEQETAPIAAAQQENDTATTATVDYQQRNSKSHRGYRSTSSSQNDQGFGPSGGHSRGERNGWQSNNSGTSASGVDPSAAYTGDTTYRDENVTITLTTYQQNSTKIYVADVTMTSAQYLKTAFANNTYGRNVTATTSEIAQSNNAIFAVNGDYYGAQESGYVIRNGIVYRGTAKGSDVLCVYANGTMEVVSDRDYTADQLVSKGVWQAFSFGPALVENGSVTVGTNTEVGRGMTSNPRTAIGVIDANHYVFVVSDGRTDESEGLTLYELAQFMQSLGVQTAYNLDGGGSSTMYFNGQIVNNPTTTGRIQERSVSDIVYIGKAS